MGEMAFYFLVVSTLAATYTRLRLFDLTSGFWAIISPHVLDGLSTGRLSFANGYVIAFFLIFCAQVAAAGVLSSAFSRHRELYTLFTFFVSLALAALGALELLSSFTAMAKPYAVSPLAYAGLFVFLLATLLTIRFNKSVALLSFTSSIESNSRKTQILASLLTALQIILWMLAGVFFARYHRGLLASSEIISIVCIASVAAVRPSSFGSILVCGSLAAGFVLLATYIDAVFQHAARLMGSLGSQIEPRALILIIAALAFAAYRHRNLPRQSESAENSRLFQAREVVGTPIAVIIVVLLVSWALFLAPQHSGKIANVLVLIAFGAVTFYAHALYGVVSIALPTVAFATLSLILWATKMPFADPMLNVVLACGILASMVILLAVYLKFLRTLPAAQAILLDLIATFSLTALLQSSRALSGPDGFLAMDALTHPAAKLDFAFAGLATVVVVAVALPALFKSEAAYKTGKAPSFGMGMRVSVLLHPSGAQFHGFGAYQTLIPFVFVLLSISILTAFFEASRATGISHDDYGLIAGLEALAIAYFCVRQRSLFRAVLVAFLFTVPMFTNAINSGWYLQLLFGVFAAASVLILARRGRAP